MLFDSGLLQNASSLGPAAMEVEDEEGGASPSYSPPASDDEGVADLVITAPAGLKQRALGSCAPLGDDDPRPCPLTKTGLCELAGRDPEAYAALRLLSQDRLPTRQELPEWCCAGGGCEAPCKGTRAFGLAEMMRHAHAKGSGASQLSDDEVKDAEMVRCKVHDLNKS